MYFEERSIKRSQQKRKRGVIRKRKNEGRKGQKERIVLIVN